jgi:SAM-dependent methyltransferase
MFNWRQYTLDPNNPAVAQKFVDFLLSIRRFSVEHRDDLILRRCQGKSVLDIGPCEHTIEYMRNPDWFFGKLKKVTSKIVGVDVNESLVKAGQSLGYDIRFVDATSTTDFQEQFDVVHGGDVIEHVTDLGGLLRFMKRHLKPNGEIFISTPNPFFKNHFLNVLRNGTLAPNFEHTCWITPSCMNELAFREGLIFKEICYPVKPSSGRRWMVKFPFFRKWMESFSSEYIFVLSLGK